MAPEEEEDNLEQVAVEIQEREKEGINKVVSWLVPICWLVRLSVVILKI
jgi:predicted RNA binding protein with dsRBD fold (UPF0201 family)